MSSTFLDQLSAELQAMQSLLAVMQQEQAFLLKADTDGLSAITEEKNQLVMQMNLAAAARHSALVLAGFAANDQGMASWLEQQGGATATSLWSALLELGKQAKETNRVNGILISKQLAHNHGALSALQLPVPGQASLYGSDGQARSAGANRRLVIG